MTELKLAPSILSADAANLAAEVGRVEEAGADYLHIDIMDGPFVPNLSYSPLVVRALRPHSGLFFDVHLMLTDPLAYAQAFADAGADLITVHQEAVPDLAAAAAQLHQMGVQAGVALKPKTPLEVLDGVLHEFDLILLMTVEPGFGGQAYISDVNDKIRALRHRLDALGLQTDIEVDGGITAENIAVPVRHGANVIVAGSAIFGAADRKQAMDRMRHIGGMAV